MIFVLLMEFMFLNRFNKSVTVQNSYVFADRVILVLFSYCAHCSLNDQVGK